MRYPASEKAEIIQLVEQSHLPAKRTLDKLGIPRATFYRWYDRYREGGPEALDDRRSRPDRVWNRIPDDVRRQIIDLALDLPELSPRELAVRFTDERKYFVSEASVYRLLKAHDLITSPAYVVIKAADEFKDKTTAINQLWQTDFTYLKITGWGWYYLSTVLDDFSRYIVAWKLCATMCADDVTATLDLALSASGLDRITVAHRPRLLSDNGSSYVAGDLAKWLEGKGMEHVRGAPYHPQTQGKIERWHQTLKNRILLENYYLPGDLERQIEAFVEHYNHVRYHESLNNLTPADVYFDRAETILAERERIKRTTIANRRLQHQLQAATCRASPVGCGYDDAGAVVLPSWWSLPVAYSPAVVLVRGDAASNRSAFRPVAAQGIYAFTPRCGHSGWVPNNGDFAFVHSITWSARTRTIGDSSILKALAMRRLILRSNLVGRSKGKSLGFVPFRTRSTCEIK